MVYVHRLQHVGRIRLALNRIRWPDGKGAVVNDRLAPSTSSLHWWVRLTQCYLNLCQKRPRNGPPNVTARYSQLIIESEWNETLVWPSGQKVIKDWRNTTKNQKIKHGLTPRFSNSTFRYTPKRREMRDWSRHLHPHVWKEHYSE